MVGSPLVDCRVSVNAFLEIVPALVDRAFLEIVPACGPHREERVKQAECVPLYFGAFMVEEL